MSAHGLTAPDVRRNAVVIYALCEPSGAVRYIGRTENLPLRLRVHRCKPANATRAWFARLAFAGQAPLVRVLATVPPGEDCATVERAAVAAAYEAGARLLNLHGTGRRRPSRKRACNRGAAELASVNLNQTAIASRLGCSGAFVNQMLGGRTPGKGLRSKIEITFGIPAHLWDEQISEGA